MPPPPRDSAPRAVGDSGAGPLFRRYTLTPVYRNVTPAQRAEAIAFWYDHRAVNESCIAERRSHELVYMARGPDGRLAGLTTVSLGRRTRDGRNVYDFHIFIAPIDRVPYLARELTNRSRDLLHEDSRTTPAAGMRLVADHPKLAGPGIRRYLERHGYLHRGLDRHGRDLWFAPFG
jgi:hypothetical protein